VTTINAGTNTISLTMASNDFGGAVNAAGVGVQLTDVNTLTPGTISSGSGRLFLTAGLIGPGGTVSGTGSLQQNVLSSNSNVTGLAIDFQNVPLVLTGSASSWTMTGPGIAPQWGVTNSATNIFYNGSPVGGAAVVAIQQSGSVIGSTLAQIARAALLEAQDTDSVQKQINYGFAGDVGTTPPMDHRIDETGISVPKCFNDSREGQTCQ
jgi:hypothetical protein